jgi:hypothetical protein
MNNMNKNHYLGILTIALFSLIIGVQAAVPQSTIQTTAGGITTYVGHYMNFTDSLYHGATNLTNRLYGYYPDLFIDGTNITNTALETNVAWGNYTGDTGDWFNHGLPGEPISVQYEMHPSNITRHSELIIPRVYDKSATQLQVAFYWQNNGSQITATLDPGFTIMWHARYETGPIVPGPP